MMPNVIASELATRKMNDEISRAAQDAVGRSTDRRARHGLLRGMRRMTGATLISIGRRVQGTMPETGSQPAGAVSGL